MFQTLASLINSAGNACPQIAQITQNGGRTATGCLVERFLFVLFLSSVVRFS